MTAPTSAYPVAVEDLLPHARTLADTIGTTPSRNALMRHLKIGAPKAAALRDALTATDFPPTPAATPVIEPTPADPPASPANPPVPSPVIEPVATPTVIDTPAVAPLAAVDGHPATLAPTAATVRTPHRVRSWPVFLIALPAFVAIWSGWVGLGELTGFGIVHPLPGIWDDFSLNTAVTLPIGVEVYAAFALRAWLAGSAVPAVARRFAKWSAICSLLVGSAGQVAYHLMESAGMTAAPWWITTLVSCLPVAVLGMGAALAHLLNSHDDSETA
ncbi:hypothetical protein HDA40_004161 [Hamadaea flava]|uniref:ABC transporter permease n=1 Tax=Hamadaea flava TaxID=1742688 RepID=A0ABV8LH06_9ACTN|nr:ABC transporter permease [Hamadaea flava]MCP2325654.1 hypothetical protein [Hamadaea flava]